MKMIGNLTTNLKIFFLISSILLSSCALMNKNSNPIADYSAKNEILSVIGIDKNGGLHAFDTVTGAPLKECSEKNPCRATVKTVNGEPVIVNGKPIVEFANGKQAKVTQATEIWIYEYIGSRCSGIYSQAAQRGYSNCHSTASRPPPRK